MLGQLPRALCDRGSQANALQKAALLRRALAAGSRFLALLFVARIPAQRSSSESQDERATPTRRLRAFPSERGVGVVAVHGFGPRIPADQGSARPRLPRPKLRRRLWRALAAMPEHLPGKTRPLVFAVAFAVAIALPL